MCPEGLFLDGVTVFKNHSKSLILQHCNLNILTFCAQSIVIVIFATLGTKIQVRPFWVILVQCAVLAACMQS